jgi:hypothetical protein
MVIVVLLAWEMWRWVRMMAVRRSPRKAAGG